MSETEIRVELSTDRQPAAEVMDRVEEVARRLMGHEREAANIISNCSQDLSQALGDSFIDEINRDGDRVVLKMLGPPSGINLDPSWGWLTAEGVNLISGEFHSNWVDHSPIRFKLVDGIPQEPDVDENEAVDVNSRDGAGHTPLHLAAEAGMSKRVRFLLGRGADIESRNNAGLTPLAMAINSDLDESQSYDTVSALIEAGADVNAASNERYRALDRAIKEEFESVQKLLKKHRALKGLGPPLEKGTIITGVVFWALIACSIYYFFFAD